MVGPLAFVVQYIVFYILVGARFRLLARRITVENAQGEVVTLAEATQAVKTPEWILAGKGLYNAYFVPLVFELPAGPNPVQTTVQLLLEAGGWYLALYLVPPVVLSFAGATVVYDTEDAFDLRFDLGDAAWRRYAMNAGLTVLLGYLPLAFLGAFLFVDGYFALAATLAVGFAYPFLFGAIGGTVVYYTMKEKNGQ